MDEIKKVGAPIGNKNRQIGDEPKTSIVYIKTMPLNKSNWVRAARKQNKKLTEFVEETLNKAADEVLGEVIK